MGPSPNYPQAAPDVAAWDQALAIVMVCLFCAMAAAWLALAAVQAFDRWRAHRAARRFVVGQVAEHWKERTS